MGIRRADHVTLLYPQMLALTSPTRGGRSVGTVLSRTKATEFFILQVMAWDRIRVPVVTGRRLTACSMARP